MKKLKKTPLKSKFRKKGLLSFAFFVVHDLTCQIWKKNEKFLTLKPPKKSKFTKKVTQHFLFLFPLSIDSNHPQKSEIMATFWGGRAHGRYQTVNNRVLLISKSKLFMFIGWLLLFHYSWCDQSSFCSQSKYFNYWVL